VVLAHNHPSQNQIPSQADIKLTKDMVAAAKFCHITALDRVVMTSEAYYSFGDEGLFFVPLLL
jgi:DNA repair protein RadC